MLARPSLAQASIRDWFRWRPDGTISYAENPPKKYEDIVNVDFYAEGAVPGLWMALRDIVLFWVGEGVRIFRVDNPHTKPLPFWEWLIADVRGRHPDVIFLAEAFTRPKMMYRLAKIGFSQSYTYFTWRNTKQELTDYLTELTTTEVAEFFRPHFFVNTPDINPYFLQTSGRAGFLIRAALAATLSGLWGVYSGFELCEAARAAGPRGISRLGEIRDPRQATSTRPATSWPRSRAQPHPQGAIPALQSHLGVTLLQRLQRPGAGLRQGDCRPRGHDPGRRQPRSASACRRPTSKCRCGNGSCPTTRALEVEDLMRGQRFVWHGKLQRLRLDPGRPAVRHLAHCAPWRTVP